MSIKIVDKIMSKFRKNRTTKYFICPICGTTASLRIKGSISGKVNHEGNVIVDYTIPRNGNFKLFCIKHLHLMLGGDIEVFDFVKIMYSAGIYVDTFSNGGEYCSSINTSNNENNPYFNALMIALNPSVESGISYDKLSEIIMEISCSDEKYLDVIKWRRDIDNYIQDEFSDCEKYDSRVIEIEVMADRALLPIEERIKFHDKNREIFISFYKQLAQRVKKEMQSIRGGKCDE